MEPILPFEPLVSSIVPTGDNWVHQVKWDGVRMLSYYNANEIKLFNRKKHERTYQYPELLTPSYCKANSFIVDGEIIALASDGKPSFHEVMRRDGIRVTSRVPQAAQAVPITYMIFDMIWCNGEWINNKPLHERQQLLNDMILPNEHIQLVTNHLDGNALLEAIRSKDMEGIVSKKLDSHYSLGSKDGRWIKIKNYGDIIAVIGGFRMEGGVVKAILTGLYREGKLIFIGKVGTGKLSSADWRELTERLVAIETIHCPFANQRDEFKNARWVLPLLTVKIQYSEWRQHENRTMRQPSIQAFVDKPPMQCLFE
ncbi:RNA ligase family protein [Cohnella sp. WQ 127256]|uniref:ATP-dependent DNA ligase n=1 Tax=Cohnella sp. WQ 127256 TaxID=2938790 RepID=UPI002117E2E5|nr:RNA ligase family protein [Cohnella sp. WQ 127256]